jgi:hypothetical protein
MRSFWAFFIFHLSVGTRLAIRRLAPLLAFVFAAYYLISPAFFHIIIAAFIQTGFLMTGFLSSILSLSIAGMASHRICHGLDGWIRHLPASQLMQRRLASVAIFAAQLPILVVLAVLAIYACGEFGVSATAYLVGLPFLGLASAQFVLPTKRNLIVRPLVAVSCLLLSSGHWMFLAGGAILLVLSDFISGPLSPKRKRLKLLHTFKGTLLTMTIGWRALRLRIFVPYILAIIILGLTVLFLSNNNFNPSLTKKVICFGGALSITIFYAFLANMLALLRPPWPWVRSLPWSSMKRIILDSLFLALHMIPLFILWACINVEAVWPITTSLPPFTFFASYSIRQAFEFRMGALGKILFIGMLGALAISILPFVSLVFLALTPLVLKHAAEEERNQKVSRWLELHHLAVGDSLSWRK